MKIIIPSWSKHQHYKERNPPWIKLHKELLDDPEYWALSDFEARILIAIWLLASCSAVGGEVDMDGKDIAWRIRLNKNADTMDNALKSLEKQGFIRLDSVALAGCGQDAMPETETETEGRQRERKGEESGFEMFWKMYPRKVAKGEALKAWNKHNPPLQNILDALAWQRVSEDWTKDGGKFIPHPSTYLNQGRWEDEKPLQSSAPEDGPDADLIIATSRERLRRQEELERGGCEQSPS